MPGQDVENLAPNRAFSLADHSCKHPRWHRSWWFANHTPARFEGKGVQNWAVGYQNTTLDTGHVVGERERPYLDARDNIAQCGSALDGLISLSHASVLGQFMASPISTNARPGAVVHPLRIL